MIFPLRCCPGPIVRLILDGTVVRVRLDRKATSISLLVVIGVREDGQKVLLAIKSMSGECAEAWRAVLDDLIKRGLRRPEFLIVDCAPGLLVDRYGHKGSITTTFSIGSVRATRDLKAGASTISTI